MRLYSVEFAKGYAIFTVVLYHTLQRAALPAPWQQAIVLGGTGIHLFFLLSGFGLSLSTLERPVEPLRFYRRRLTKVWLPYVLALTLSLLAAYTLNLFPDRWEAWLAGVFQYQMFVERYIASFGGHFWFISTIIQFYLVFPLLVRLQRAMRSDIAFFALCFGLSAAWWVTVYALGKGDLRIWNSCFLQFLWEYALGMVLAPYLVRLDSEARWRMMLHRDLMPRWARWSFWVLLPIGICCIGIMIMLVYMLGPVGKIFNDVPALLGYAALCGFVYRLGERMLPAAIDFFVWIAGFSFSLYLVHVLVLELYLGVFHWFDRAWTWVWLLPYVPLALLAGRAFEPLSRWWTRLWSAENGVRRAE